MSKPKTPAKPLARPAIDDGDDVEGSAPAARPRAYKGAEEVDHDLFKLEVARMVKNISWDDSPDLVKFEHCHIFHTVDSSGRKQTTCGPVGGHFHEIEVVNTGGVPTLKVSEPRKWVLKKVRGKMQRTAVPVALCEPGEASGEGMPDGFDGVDRHTHKVTYLRSEKVRLRVTDPDFAKFESAERARKEPAAVEGVVTR